MTRHFQNEIERLKKKILFLATMVEEALQNAVTAVNNTDDYLATQVINSDSDIDTLEIEVEEECLKILALHQPVAADLRYVVAVLKINNDLERIADLAVNIAKRAKERSVRKPAKAPFDLSAMLDAVVDMVRDSVDSLVRKDVSLAQQVCDDDDRVDNLHESAFRTVEQEIVKDPKGASGLINILSVSRNLERIADHATNIAEDVIYMIEGEIVRHRSSLGIDDEKP